MNARHPLGVVPANIGHRLAFSASDDLALNVPREFLYLDYGPFMEPARDEVVLIAGLDLKRDRITLSMDDSCLADYPLSKGSRREVTQFDFSADRPLVRFEKWGQR